MDFACCKCGSPDLSVGTRSVFLIAREVVAKTTSGGSMTLTRLEEPGPIDFGNHETSRFSILTFDRVNYDMGDYRPGDWRRYRPVRRTAVFLCGRCWSDPNATQRAVLTQLKEREGLWAQDQFPWAALRGDLASYNIQTAFPDDATLAWPGDVKLVFNLPEHHGMPLTPCPLIYKVDDLIQGAGELHVPSSTEITTQAGIHQVSIQIPAAIAMRVPPVTVQCESGGTYVIAPGQYDKMWGRLKPAVVWAA